MADANRDLNRIIEMQSAAIRDLEAEISLLHARADGRKPGGRPRLPDETVRRIEDELGRGISCRGIAKAFSVSAMTVSRIKSRMDERAG